MNRFSFLPIFFASILMYSCFEQGDCQNQTSNEIKIGFFKASDGRSIKIQLDSVIISGIQGKFIENKLLDGVVIPLDPASANSLITFYTPTGISIIKIGYQARTTVLDPACGATDLFTLQSVSGEGINSAVIAQPLISVSLTTNIRVYF